MVSFVPAVDGQPYAAANYNQLRLTVEGHDTRILSLEQRRCLGVTSTTSTITNNNTPATTLVSTTVTIPSGLPAGSRIKVTGTIGHGSTGTGVGMVVDITNASSAGSAVTTGGSLSGGVIVTRYDDAPAAGSRTYTMTMVTTVAGQTVTARGAQIQAEIC